MRGERIEEQTGSRFVVRSAEIFILLQRREVSLQETMTESSPYLSGSNVKECEEECTRKLQGSSRLRIQDKCIKKNKLGVGRSYTQLFYMYKIVFTNLKYGVRPFSYAFVSSWSYF